MSDLRNMGVDPPDKINPKFWIEAIRTALYCTDCDSKRRALMNAANHLETYISGRCNSVAVTTTPPSSARSAEGMVTDERLLAGAMAYEAVLDAKTAKPGRSLSIEAMRAALEAALTARPDGWVLVPREPTEAMSTAGKHYLKGCESSTAERVQAIGVWNVMLTAAQPEQGE